MQPISLRGYSPTRIGWPGWIVLKMDRIALSCGSKVIRRFDLTRIIRIAMLRPSKFCWYCKPLSLIPACLGMALKVPDRTLIIRKIDASDSIQNRHPTSDEEKTAPCSQSTSS